MKVDFKTKELEEYYYNEPSGKLKFQPSVYLQYKKVVDFMKASISFTDLKTFTGLRIHALKHDLKGKYSAKVNAQYRIVFSVVDDEIEIESILIENLTDYH